MACEGFDEFDFPDYSSAFQPVDQKISKKDMTITHSRSSSSSSTQSFQPMSPDFQPVSSAFTPSGVQPIRSGISQGGFQLVSPGVTQSGFQALSPGFVLGGFEPGSSSFTQTEFQSQALQNDDAFKPKRSEDASFNATPEETDADPFSKLAPSAASSTRLAHIEDAAFKTAPLESFVRNW